MNEIWKTISAHPAYEASNLGRIRSWKRPVALILKPRALPKGYLQVHLDQVNVSVHQAVLAAFVGPRPEGMQTRHLDGNPTNNRLSNLRYGTASENQFDRIRHGTYTNPSSRKTECKHGHPFDDANTRVRMERGRVRQRVCIECRRRRSREAGARRRATSTRRTSYDHAR